MISFDLLFKQFGNDVSHCATLLNGFHPDFLVDVFPQVDSLPAVALSWKILVTFADLAGLPIANSSRGLKDMP